MALVEELIGQSGWLVLQYLRIESFDSDEYLLFSAIDDSGNNIDQETCEKLFYCNEIATDSADASSEIVQRLQQEQDRHIEATIVKNLDENNRHFSEVRDQLDKCADDMEKSSQKELDDTKHRIRELQRQARQAATLEE